MSLLTVISINFSVCCVAIYSTHSRVYSDCTSCDVGHKVLPLRSNKPQWTKGRKLVILADQNFPASLPSTGKKCPAIIRVEGGLLSELFYSLLRDFTLPDWIAVPPHGGGVVGYAKGLGVEFRRFSKLFDYDVHVIPFVRHDPELRGNR